MTRAGFRRLRFGLATLVGARPLGFFIPYRHAGALPPDRGAPGLLPLFEDAEPRGLALLDGLRTREAELRAILAAPERPGEPRFTQDWFPRLDAALAYEILRRERPARLLEIGSGHSTRFLARAVRDGGLATEITCIDPQPRAALPPGLVHLPRLLSAEDAERVGRLGPGDVLFVDSSHVAMPGTDLDLLVGALIPRLTPGALLHIHDILLPDPYPAEWRWRGYNESLVVAALLAGGGFEIVASSHWLASRRPEALTGVLAEIPLKPGARETSLWLRRR